MKLKLTVENLMGVFRCRQCKHWYRADNGFGYGYGVCSLKPTKRNQFGFQKMSARSMHCLNFEIREETK